MLVLTSRSVQITVIGIVACLGSVYAQGHHAFSAEFDVGRPVTLNGPIVEIEWTNPHAWLHIEAKDQEGKSQNWAVELVGINALVRFGFTRKTVKVGDELTIEGFGARNGSYAANASTITHTESGDVLWTSRAAR